MAISGKQQLPRSDYTVDGALKWNPCATISPRDSFFGDLFSQITCSLEPGNSQVTLCTLVLFIYNYLQYYISSCKVSNVFTI